MDSRTLRRILLATTAALLVVGCASRHSSVLGSATDAPSDASTAEAIASSDAGGEAASNPKAAADAAREQPIDPDEAAIAAVFVGSCVPDDGVSAYMADVYTELQFEPFERAWINDPAVRACLKNKKNGCAALTDCSGITVSRVSSCKDGCDGDDSVQCDGTKLEFRANCAKFGLACTVIGSSPRPECLPPGISLEACDWTTYAPSCENGRPKYCSYRGVELGPRCSDFGFTCEAAGSTTPPDEDVCRSDGPTCDTGYSPARITYDALGCVGTKLRTCVNNTEVIRGCAAIGDGFTCRTVDGKSFCGLAEECAPGRDAKSSCQGDTLVSCNAGRIEHVDCKALGFQSCQETMGVDGHPIAVCAPSPWIP